MMRTCCARYAEDGGFGLPAPTPQVHLHYAPYTRRSGKRSGALPRQRMDFLLLAPDRSRIVTEVDGVQQLQENPGMAMARHRYSSSPVVDGNPFLEEPGFRPAYLADLADGFAPEAFESDAGDADGMLDTLHDPSAWPVFTVPLADGFAIVVHFNRGEEFTTRDYFLTHPDRSQDLVPAAMIRTASTLGRAGPRSPYCWRRRPGRQAAPALTPVFSFFCLFTAIRRFRRTP
ncbi:hypothetical protein ABZ871_11570 [Streptomyces populi]